MTTHTRPRWIVAALLALATLAGCSASSSYLPAPEVDRAPADGTQTASTSDYGKPAEGSVPSTTTRSVTKTAEMTLTITDPAASAAALANLATGLGGYLAYEYVVTEQSDGLYTEPSSVTILVPSEKLDAAMDSVAKLGTVTYRVVNTTDVTDQVIDLDARIRTVRDSIARLQSLMDKAGTVTEIAAVEQEITARQTELEQLLGQQKSLADQIALSPISVTLRTSAVAATPNPFVQGLQEGWNALVYTVRALMLVLGVALPLAGVALVVIVAIVAIRRARRRGAAKPSPAAAPSETPAEPKAPADR